MSENVEWIHARERFKESTKSRFEPLVDEVVSQIVGRKVFALDPRLLQIIIKWKKQKNKSQDSMEPDNFLEDPKKREELKKIFSQSL